MGAAIKIALMYINSHQLDVRRPILKSASIPFKRTFLLMFFLMYIKVIKKRKKELHYKKEEEERVKKYSVDL